MCHVYLVHYIVLRFHHLKEFQQLLEAMHFLNLMHKFLLLIFFLLLLCNLTFCINPFTLFCYILCFVYVKSERKKHSMMFYHIMLFCMYLSGVIQLHYSHVLYNSNEKLLIGVHILLVLFYQFLDKYRQSFVTVYGHELIGIVVRDMGERLPE